MNAKTTLISTGLICLLIGGAAGYFGRPLLQPARPQFAGNRAMNAGGNRMQFAGGRFGNGMRPTIGTIENVADGHITIKMMDGSTKIVVTTPSTTYQKTAPATAADFPTGSAVFVNGQENPDGSITASMVQDAPRFTGNGSPSPTP